MTTIFKILKNDSATVPGKKIGVLCSNWLSILITIWQAI
jgi:hypothetical protein